MNNHDGLADDGELQAYVVATQKRSALKVLVAGLLAIGIGGFLLIPLYRHSTRPERPAQVVRAEQEALRQAYAKRTPVVAGEISDEQLIRTGSYRYEIAGARDETVPVWSVTAGPLLAVIGFGLVIGGLIMLLRARRQGNYGNPSDDLDGQIRANLERSPRSDAE